MDQIFDRIADAVELELMASTTITVGGLGSGGHYISKAVARCSAGAVVGIDGDRVSPPNVAVSDYFARDAVARTKGEATAEAVRAIGGVTKFRCYECMDNTMPAGEMDKLFAASDLVVNATDDIGAAIRLNELGVRHSRLVIHAATHPGNRAFEIIGTMPGGPCYECLAGPRCDKFRADGEPAPESFATFYAPATMRNVVLLYVVLGLIHHRAGSNRPIAAWGKAFANHPHWIGALAPDAFRGDGNLFGDVPDDLFFGVRPYHAPKATSAACAVCGFLSP